tara:strand:+ start:2839 stop:3207 length:369 start_codon:yes stop_codon:yes gene_type:complete
MAFPVNFSTKLKEAKAIDGKGYPYAIKAEDLMKNLVWAALDVDETVHSSGLQLGIAAGFGEDGHTKRIIYLSGTVSGLPTPASEGDIARYEGGEWVNVSTEWIQVSVCIDGTPTAKYILAQT